jgi:hypothetical protein
MPRLSPVLFALCAGLLSSPAAWATPVPMTTSCTASQNAKTIWVGYATDPGPAGDWFRTESVVMGPTTKAAVLYTDALDVCGLNGLTGDILNTVVVLHLSDGGQPVGVIAVFADGTVHVNMQPSTAAAAHALLVEQERLTQANVFYSRMPMGPLKTHLGNLL